MTVFPSVACLVAGTHKVFCKFNLLRHPKGTKCFALRRRLAFITSFLAILALSSSQVYFAGPTIEVSEPEIDCGKIQQNIPKTVTYTIRNTGDEPLSILKCSTTTCTCTMEPSKHPILKGRTGTIKVTYDAKALGNFVKEIKVSTNALNVPVYILVLKGTVKPSAKAKTKNPDPPSRY